MRTRLMGVLVLALAGGAGLAQGGTVTLTASAQGWLTAGGDNGNLAGNNYLAGNCGVGDCDTGEYRNHFDFQPGLISGTITSASVVIDSAQISLLQSGSLVYELFSLGASYGFADIGTGTSYGSRTYTEADAFDLLTISLNGDALAAIATSLGGTFRIGGRVTSPVVFGAEEQHQMVFASSNDLSPQLVINYSGAEAPEPGTVLLLGAGLVGLGAWRHRAGISFRSRGQ